MLPFQVTKWLSTDTLFTLFPLSSSPELLILYSCSSSKELSFFIALLSFRPAHVIELGGENSPYTERY